jgi:hypothetical protein
METVVLPEWHTLRNEIMGHARGKLFKHEELAKVLSVPVGSHKYYTLMQSTIKSLTEVGIRLSNVKNVGYKILLADEWVHEAKAKMNKGGRSLLDAQLILNNAPYTEMSEVMQKEALKVHDKLIKHKFLLAGGVTEVLDNNPKQPILLREGNKL